MSKFTPIKDLNQGILFTNRVSELHLKSLNSYPFIFFNEVSDGKIEYEIASLERKGKTIITYYLHLNMEANDHLEKRYKALEEAIRSIFWKEAEIKIIINDKEVYCSE